MPNEENLCKTNPCWCLKIKARACSENPQKPISPVCNSLKINGRFGNFLAEKSYRRELKLAKVG